MSAVHNAAFLNRNAKLECGCHHGLREGPVESAAEAPINDKSGTQHSLNSNYWSCCSYMIILARPDATGAME